MDKFLENIKSNPELGHAFEVMLYGMLGIFIVLFIVYLVIKLLNFAFPERKIIRRKINRATGEIISQE